MLRTPGTLRFQASSVSASADPHTHRQHPAHTANSAPKRSQHVANGTPTNTEPQVDARFSMSSPPLFLLLRGNQNFHYSANLSGLVFRNLSDRSAIHDGTYFTTRSMRVTLRAAGPFSSELTSRDDVLLAFLSMFLVLVIEGVLATVLLRTRKGEVTVSGFAIKYFVEMTRDYNFHHLWEAGRGKAKRKRRQEKASFKLLLLGISALLSTFGLEVLVLFLTAPKRTPVTNSTVSLRVQVPIIPYWNFVRYNVRASINKPCTALSLSGVDQGGTRVTACVISNVSTSTDTFFRMPEDGVRLEIVTVVHPYGAEHYVSIGNLSATYSTKALFTLDDEKPRLMAQRSRKADKVREMELVHQQFIAYLFTVFVRVNDDSEENFRSVFQHMNRLRPNFKSTEGDQIEVIQEGGRPVKVPSTRYSTTLTGNLPQGPMVLHFAHQYFRAAAAVFVAEPDETDLFEDEGVKTAKSVVWRETTRALNLLSLSGVLFFAAVILVLLRLKLRPQSTADLAAIFVKNAVGADVSRSPVELVEEQEDSFFRFTPVPGEIISFKTVPLAGEYFYAYGAETEEGWDWTDLEYASTDDTSGSLQL